MLFLNQKTFFAGACGAGSAGRFFYCGSKEVTFLAYSIYPPPPQHYPYIEMAPKGAIIANTALSQGRDTFFTKSTKEGL
jgi:hypothetical protein